MLLDTCNVTLGVFCGGVTTVLLGQPLVIFPGAVVAPVVGALVGVDPAPVVVLDPQAASVNRRTSSKTSGTMNENDCRRMMQLLIL